MEKKAKGKPKQKQTKTVFNAEEQHLIDVTTTTAKTTTSTNVTKVRAESAKMTVVDKESDFNEELDATKNLAKKELKNKRLKSKTSSNTKQNISMKKSFSKFDALQRHDEKHCAEEEKLKNCRVCQKPVYKMEEIKAEKNIFHKNCFRCHECLKQLKVDNYQSHERVFYCLVHFKSLFAPKVVESSDAKSSEQTKVEVIIRESQPVELPPDVARASDKPNLGLEELQQINVRSKFQVFENAHQQSELSNCHKMHKEISSNSSRRSSTAIISKLKKLKKHGIIGTLDAAVLTAEDTDSESIDKNSSSDAENLDDFDVAILQNDEYSGKQRERPFGMMGDTMKDIKTKFEKGNSQTKDDRREERKQEIQNIRSRLFQGKQAKFKEMYQQAVAESEQGIISADKKTDIEVREAAHLIKERFETGEMFKINKSQETSTSKSLPEDATVFEFGISKNSRSMFLELDANAEISKAPIPLLSHKKLNQINDAVAQSNKQTDDIIKYDEKLDDVKIETSELSEKFKFFESYRPSTNEKRIFRITPPREGVVKLPSPEIEDKNFKNMETILYKTQTTSAMLNMFREMEQNKSHNGNKSQVPRPLKCFTPPPDDSRKYEGSNNSDEDDEEVASDTSDSLSDDYFEGDKLSIKDEALEEAKAAARAKQLRQKFEKWQTNEMERELKEGIVDIYSQQTQSDSSSIESTQILRKRFENMNNLERNTASGPRYQVNRFV